MNALAFESAEVWLEILSAINRKRIHLLFPSRAFIMKVSGSRCEFTFGS